MRGMESPIYLEARKISLGELGGLRQMQFNAKQGNIEYVWIAFLPQLPFGFR